MTTYTTADGDTVDYICYVYYGSTKNRIPEQVYEANLNLSNYGASLPAGVAVVLPDIESVQEEETDIVRLWD